MRRKLIKILQKLKEKQLKRKKKLIKKVKINKKKIFLKYLNFMRAQP